MILRETFDKPINGYWDGGAKARFDWLIEYIYKDGKGYFAKIGSFEANHWFCVASGKTNKQTLSYAKRHLSRLAKKQGAVKFEYILEDSDNKKLDAVRALQGIWANLPEEEN